MGRFWGGRTCGIWLKDEYIFQKWVSYIYMRPPNNSPQPMTLAYAPCSVYLLYRTRFHPMKLHFEMRYLNGYYWTHHIRRRNMQCIHYSVSQLSYKKWRDMKNVVKWIINIYQNLIHITVIFFYFLIKLRFYSIIYWEISLKAF